MFMFRGNDVYKILDNTAIMKLSLRVVVEKIEMDG